MISRGKGQNNTGGGGGGQYESRGKNDMGHGLIKKIIKQFHLFYISIKRNMKILKSEYFNIYPNIPL